MSPGFTPEASHTVADLVSDRDARDFERLRATITLQQQTIRQDAAELESLQLERDLLVDEREQWRVEAERWQRAAKQWKERHDQEVRARCHVDLRGMAAVVAEVVQRQLAAHGVAVTEAQARDAANNAMQAIAGAMADEERAA